ncbi:hypothetical protein CR513_38412, partial [Mucuna pruriens]
MNDVTEQQNQTLKDMGEALKTVVYILNRMPSKAPCIKHLHIWGCPVETRPYKPNERKLDSRIVSYDFVGYAKRSRGYKFYDPTLRRKMIQSTSQTQLPQEHDKRSWFNRR